MVLDDCVDKDDDSAPLQVITIPRAKISPNLFSPKDLHSLREMIEIMELFMVRNPVSVLSTSCHCVALLYKYAGTPELIEMTRLQCCFNYREFLLVFSISLPCEILCSAASGGYCGVILYWLALSKTRENAEKNPEQHYFLLGEMACAAAKGGQPQCLAMLLDGFDHEAMEYKYHKLCHAAVISNCVAVCEVLLQSQFGFRIEDMPLRYAAKTDAVENVAFIMRSVIAANCLDADSVYADSERFVTNHALRCLDSLLSNDVYTAAAPNCCNDLLQFAFRIATYYLDEIELILRRAPLLTHDALKKMMESACSSTSDAPLRMLLDKNGPAARHFFAATEKQDGAAACISVKCLLCAARTGCAPLLRLALQTFAAPFTDTIFGAVLHASVCGSNNTGATLQVAMQFAPLAVSEAVLNTERFAFNAARRNNVDALRLMDSARFDEMILTVCASCAENDAVDALTFAMARLDNDLFTFVIQLAYISANNMALRCMRMIRSLASDQVQSEVVVVNFIHQSPTNARGLRAFVDLYKAELAPNAVALLHMAISHSRDKLVGVLADLALEVEPQIRTVPDVCTTAARKGNSETLRCLIKNGFAVTDDAVVEAITHDKLSALNVLLKCGLIQHKTTMVCAAAARHSGLPVVREIRKCGYPWSPDFILSAAAAGKFTVIEYALFNDPEPCAWDPSLFVRLASAKPMPSLLISRLHARGLDGPADTSVHDAARAADSFAWRLRHLAKLNSMRQAFPFPSPEANKDNGGFVEILAS